MKNESPEYLRMSLAAAITLGFKDGLFYRNAKSPCINLLLTYDSGCAGNCAYCGLSMKRPGTYENKSFIRVRWDLYKLDDIMEKIGQNKDKVKRICLSMITNSRARRDTIHVTKILVGTAIPISILISPTIVSREDLYMMKESGAERVGIAIDAANSSLFDGMRGAGVGGPHKWDRYWDCFAEAIEIFGERFVGAHLIVGLGETEKEMVEIIQRVYDMGGCAHLFSFFPENDSLLARFSQPPAGHYRRIQLARYLIDENISCLSRFSFDDGGRFIQTGIDDAELLEVISSGRPFMTSGCPDEKGEVACNRPYSDSLPGDDIRNFPFVPNSRDIEKILSELWQ